ncbi:hypothetical protein NEHOM01_1387 [Nematocida homosporus]|uniref:uncharacterized protein n=1 Tax=Nematocida homosporus TaxID=1912981 RepID=UPI002220644D|nr:uncharacterized protein NEHOM01_1387 [Nematocida homosporus]KAI5186323.1 hypothetical protein NEHOM01_1387 [Nematocida homosporus]
MKLVSVRHGLVLAVGYLAVVHASLFDCFGQATLPVANPTITASPALHMPKPMGISLTDGESLPLVDILQHSWDVIDTAMKMRMAADATSTLSTNDPAYDIIAEKMQGVFSLFEMLAIFINDEQAKEEYLHAVYNLEIQNMYKAHQDIVLNHIADVYYTTEISQGLKLVPGFNFVLNNIVDIERGFLHSRGKYQTRLLSYFSSSKQERRLGDIFAGIRWRDLLSKKSTSGLSGMPGASGLSGMSGMSGMPGQLGLSDSQKHIFDYSQYAGDANPLTTAVPFAIHLPIGLGTSVNPIADIIFVLPQAGVSTYDTWAKKAIRDPASIKSIPWAYFDTDIFFANRDELDFAILSQVEAKFRDELAKAQSVVNLNPFTAVYTMGSQIIDLSALFKVYKAICALHVGQNDSLTKLHFKSFVFDIVSSCIKQQISLGQYNEKLNNFYQVLYKIYIRYHELYTINQQAINFWKLTAKQQSRIFRDYTKGCAVLPVLPFSAWI